jgi:hypothetical protein
VRLVPTGGMGNPRLNAVGEGIVLSLSDAETRRR